MDTRSGQYKWNIATGASHVVGSPATEHPNLERQADLIDYLSDSERLLRWNGQHACDSGNVCHNDYMDANKCLYTIGYGGRGPREMAGMLKSAWVKTLVDIRSRPSSRIPGFSKSSLAQWLSAEGIEYVHLWTLGAANWQDSSTAARSDLLNDEPAGLEALAAILVEGPTAIMCAEKRYTSCHREYVAERMKKSVAGLEVSHLV